LVPPGGTGPIRQREPRARLLICGSHPKPPGGDALRCGNAEAPGLVLPHRGPSSSALRFFVPAASDHCLSRLRTWPWRIRPAASVCRINLRLVNHSMRMRKLPVPAPRCRLRAAVLDRATSMPVHLGFRLAAGSQGSRDGSLNRVLRVANWMQSPARPLDRLRGDCPLHSSHRMCGAADATRDEQS
jgi:hypothetical protein